MLSRSEKLNYGSSFHVMANAILLLFSGGSHASFLDFLSLHTIFSATLMTLVNCLSSTSSIGKSPPSKGVSHLQNYSLIMAAFAIAMRKCIKFKLIPVFVNSWIDSSAQPMPFHLL